MMTTLNTTKKNEALWQQYQHDKQQTKMLFPTEGAAKLGVSEFELMLAAPFSRYMGSECKTVLKQFEVHADTLGQLESIVRNDLAVHEKIGVYQNLHLGDKMGLSVNVGGLDLRIFMSQWQHMLAVNDTTKPDKPVYSIQFYDKAGNAINKVYLKQFTEAHLNQWQDIIDTHTPKPLPETIALEAHDGKQTWQYKALSEDDLTTLHKEWLAITDVHQFHFLLKKLKVDRASSFKQAPENMATPLKIAATQALLETVKHKQCPIMIFVGNTGMVQIQTGVVHNLVRLGDWINILDKKETDFTLHLKDKAIMQLWCVKRPTADGVVTCIEGFDEWGDSVFSIFGQRLEGEHELAQWQAITDEIMEAFVLSK